MPTCFCYLQFRLQHFHLPDMEVLRASLPMDTEPSRWDPGTRWHGGPHPVGHALVLPCPSHYRVPSKDPGQPEANSLAHWSVLLLHPALLLHQPQR